MSRPLKIVAVVVAAVVVAVGSGCETSPRVGPSPGSSVEYASPSPSPTNVLKVEVSIDSKSVTPLNKEFTLSLGQVVDLVVRTDHNATLVIEGPEVNQSVFVGRKMTVPATFVARQPGVITVKSKDPAATIARFTVS